MRSERTHATVAARSDNVLVLLQAISVHMEAAKEHTVEFNEISKEVEVFPIKIGSALREASKPVGFLESVLGWIEE